MGCHVFLHPLPCSHPWRSFPRRLYSAISPQRVPVTLSRACVISPRAGSSPHPNPRVWFVRLLLVMFWHVLTERDGHGTCFLFQGALLGFQTPTSRHAATALYCRAPSPARPTSFPPHNLLGPPPIFAASLSGIVHSYGPKVRAVMSLWRQASPSSSSLVCSSTSP